MDILRKITMPEYPEIEYQHIPEMTAVSARLNLKQRANLYPALVNLRARIPAEAIDGPPFWGDVTQFLQLQRRVGTPAVGGRVGRPIAGRSGRILAERG